MMAMTTRLTMIWDSLSTHKCLKTLSLFAIACSGYTDVLHCMVEIHCALSAIIRLIKSAPSIQAVVLAFNFNVLDISSLGVGLVCFGSSPDRCHRRCKCCPHLRVLESDPNEHG